MELLTREAYFDLPDKSTTGIPTQYYGDYQRSSTVFYIWRALSSITTETIQYTYQKKYDDIDSLNNNTEMRPQFLECVGYNLATRLGPDYGRVGTAWFNQIKETEIILLQEAPDEDREDEVRFVPDARPVSHRAMAFPHIAALIGGAASIGGALISVNAAKKAGAKAGSSGADGSR